MSSGGTERDPRASEHEFVTSESRPFVETSGMRACARCDHAEVRLEESGAWVSLDQYLATRAQVSAGA